MNILMEKRTNEGIKGRLKGKMTLSTIHLKKLSLGEELGEQTRVSAGNPFGTSDSAVKLSALALESRIRQ
jgi:hypothetical protein